MTDKIAEIRKRYAFAEENKSAIRPAGFSWTIPGWQAHNDRSYLLAEVDRLTRERDEARAENQRLRAERDTLLLDAADFVRWFDRHYPDPSSKPGHPWCVINSRLNAHADTLRALDSGLGAKP